MGQYSKLLAERDKLIIAKAQLLSVLQAIAREADFDLAGERVDLGQRLLSIKASANVARAKAEREPT